VCVEFFLVQFPGSKVLYWLYFGAKKATYRETSSCVHTAWLGGTLRGNVHKNTITFCDVLVVLPTQFYAKILLWLYFQDNGNVFLCVQRGVQPCRNSTKGYVQYWRLTKIDKGNLATHEDRQGHGGRGWIALTLRILGQFA